MTMMTTTLARHTFIHTPYNLMSTACWKVSRVFGNPGGMRQYQKKPVWLLNIVMSQ